MTKNNLNFPLVSLIITTCNREKLIGRAVYSALGQDYPNLEIIVVDDGSKDGTSSLLTHLSEKNERLRVYRHDRSCGGNAARNTGIRGSTGEFVAGLDDDDLLFPNHISELMKAYDSRYAFVASRSVQCGNSFDTVTSFHGQVSASLINIYNVVGNQALIEKKRLEAVGLYDESLKRYQDYDVWLRLIDSYGSALVVNRVTQMVFLSSEERRANEREKNLAGLRAFYSKHSARFGFFRKLVVRVNIFFYETDSMLAERFSDYFVKVATKIQFLTYLALKRGMR